MKRLLLSIFLLSTLAVIPVARAADNAVKPGLYGSLGLSHVTLRDSDFSDGTDSVTVESDGGYGIMAALGYRFTNNLRAEGEIAYRHNDLDNVEGIDLNGDAKAWSFMANGYYDFNTGGVQPYLGAGIGVARVSQDSTFTVGGFTYDSEGSDTVLAYQAIVGVAVPVATDTNIGVEYRYFGTQNPEDEGVEAEYGTHNIGVRLNHSF
ncbi:MAG: porin family protein [Alphaproteobacteria bacterium]|nr:MAG: porin family protein [Alphaproteobacteria bacterium]